VTMATEVAGPTHATLHRADGVELIGEMAGSGYRVPPSLVRRADGQTIQLTPLLYATLHEIDGRRTAEEVAAAVSESTGRNVNEDNIGHLVDKQLRPLGLLVLADGSQPKAKKRNPLLGLRFRYAVTEPDRTRRLTAPFRFLFRPWMAIPVLAAFAVVCWWVFFSKGLAHAAYDAFERPGLLILVFAITIASAGFHEFGHAAAARYGGATPGVMGFGVYLVWPAFYTDVTDAYRLGRGGRVRTDLGGLYFNAIVAVAITGLWWSLHYDALLLVVATQILQMLRQLAPMVRFDGYHLLADITGVPDLFSRIKPTLLGVLPWRWGDPHARMLKPWARIVVTVWVMVVVPLLLCTLAATIIAMPRLVGTAWSALGKQEDVLTTAWADGDMIQATARVLAIIAILIPVAGVTYMLIRIARRSAVGAWQGTAGKPVMRLLVILLGAAVMAGIAFAWWPGEGKYRPIQPWERGTVGDIAYALRVEHMNQPHRTVNYAPRPAAVRHLVKGQRGVMRSVWDTRTSPPTFTQPQLAVILVPKTIPGARVGGGGGGIVTAPTTVADKGWVFPFDKPLVLDPENGDNQALAVNTTDGTVDYEAAFAMVWVTDNSDAMNINDAEAWASCDSCASVAVAYQVVFVIDTDDADNNVVAPQNLAGALNYNCVNCLTYALAQQLFITLDDPLSDESMAALDELWLEIGAYEDKIAAGQVPLDQIDDQLAAYTEQIKQIVAADQPGTFSTATVTATQATAPPTATPTATPSPTPTASSTATPTPSPSATESPTASSTSSPTPTSSSSPTTSSSDPTGTTSDPTTSGGSTSTGTTSDGSTSSGTTSDGTTSGGTTSDGSTSGGTATSP
jgi:putative peptide zinc metalloprotease protein